MNMDQLFTVIHKCRLCLKLGEFCSIFEEDDSVKLSQMVMSFADIRIFEGDGLSDKVCNSCIENLSAAYLFKLQCERVDTLLRIPKDIHPSCSIPVCDGLTDKKFTIHTFCAEHDNNNVKDGNYECKNAPDTSDETDSDMDSIKCVYCNKSYNSFGVHTCTVTCAIEHENSNDSEETLVAEDIHHPMELLQPAVIQNHLTEVACVLCDEKYCCYDNTSSRESTPKKVSFRKLFQDGKTKTSNYLPFRRYIQNYRSKKRSDSYKQPLQIQEKDSKPMILTDSDYGSPTGTSEDSWKLKQNLVCACDKKIFMISESLQNRVTSMITELGGVVAENTKMEMLATHFISSLPNDTCSGMMVCALATGKWLLHVNYIYDSYRGKRFLPENLYEWMRHPKILEVDNTSIEVAKAAVYWQRELQSVGAKYPFEGAQVILIMKKKYRQYYQMVFKTLKAKPIAYDPRTPGSCCFADYCFVDMRIIERVKLKFFASHNIPVYPYQYILVYLLSRGKVEDEHKYLLQHCNKVESRDTVDFLNNTY